MKPGQTILYACGCRHLFRSKIWCEICKKLSFMTADRKCRCGHVRTLHRPGGAP